MSTSSQSLPRQSAIDPAQLGIWIFLATISMLFAAFTSAYLVRRVAADWVQINLPSTLWLNSVILIGSTVTLERARSALSPPRSGKGAILWLDVTLALGFAFLIGQLFAWSQLAGQGVYIPTSPQSSFFYIYTGLHGLHLLGGIILLVVVTLRCRGLLKQDPSAALRLTGLAATYWHFLAGLWIFIFLVFKVL